MRQRLDAQGRMQTSEGKQFFVHERALLDAATHDEDSLPHKLPMPVFVAHGTHDELVPTRLSESFFAALPFGHKELWVVPNGNHRLNQEIGDILARMEAFLQRTGAI
jgi:pimeloyl-ACP methyl ester carboxylesterase